MPKSLRFRKTTWYIECNIANEKKFARLTDLHQTKDIENFLHYTVVTQGSFCYRWLVLMFQLKEDPSIFILEKNSEINICIGLGSVVVESSFHHIDRVDLSLPWTSEKRLIGNEHSECLYV